MDLTSFRLIHAEPVIVKGGRVLLFARSEIARDFFLDLVIRRREQFDLQVRKSMREEAERDKKNVSKYEAYRFNVQRSEDIQENRDQINPAIN